jgi:hypothetical protein
VFVLHNCKHSFGSLLGDRMFRITTPEGRTATMALYTTPERAQDAIDSWIERYYLGGRTDTSLEYLESLIIVEA